MPCFCPGNCIRVCGEHILIEKWLGSGMQADIYQVFSIDRGKRYAMKHLYGRFAPDPALFHAKVELLTRYKSPHPAFAWPMKVGNFDPETHAFVYLMELLDKEYQPVALLMKQQELLGDKQKLLVIYQIAEAINALHEMRLVYCDISATNELFRLNADGSVTVKIVDNDNISVEPEDEALVTAVCGSGLFRAPEVMRGKLPDRNSDNHSLAVLAFRILTGMHPLDGRMDSSLAFTPQTIINEFALNPVFLQKNKTRYLPDRLEQYFKKAFSSSCLLNKTKRPTAADLLNSLK